MLLNPYDFVPLEDAPCFVDAIPAQDRASGLSGRIDFRLHMLTPLCVQHDPPGPGKPPRRLYEFAQVGKTRILPATSLKGAFRSVHEIFTNSALGAISPQWRVDFPPAYLPRGNGETLTPSEALFGTVTDISGGASYAGRVLFNDIALPLKCFGRDDQRLPTVKITQAQGGPKPDHWRFYFRPNGTPEGAPLGRKRYYHHDPEIAAREYRRRGMSQITVEVVQKELFLSSSLRFVNLTESELDSLVYTLALENGLAHKIGYARPLGYGSVRVEIMELLIEKTCEGIPARFLVYDDDREIEPDDWKTRRDRAKTAWLNRPHGAASHKVFTTIARWQDEQSYVYPTRQFFDDHPTMMLWEAQGRGEIWYPGLTINSESLVQQNLIQVDEPPEDPAPPEDPPPLEEPGDARTTRTLHPGENDGYRPFVDDSSIKYRLIKNVSGTAEIIEALDRRLTGGEPVKIRCLLERKKINKRYENVLLNVEFVDESK